MKGRILTAVSVFGLSVLFAVTGSAFAGGNDPQEIWSWQHEEAIETGTLPGVEGGKRKLDVPSLPSSDMGIATVDFDADPRWKESGGE